MTTITGAQRMQYPDGPHCATVGRNLYIATRAPRIYQYKLSVPVVNIH
jgi:hypothetical protein